MGVDDVVAVVGHQGFVVVHSKRGGAPQRRLDRSLRCAEGKRCHFDGEGERSEAIHLLSLVCHDDHGTSGLGNDFFSKQGRTSTFDELKRRIEFIGAIDDHVKVTEVVKLNKGNTNLLGKVAGCKRGGNADDVQPLFLNSSPEFKDGVFHG